MEVAANQSGWERTEAAVAAVAGEEGPYEEVGQLLLYLQ